MFKKPQEDAEITHHERNTGTKLYCWATWGRADYTLCKSEDICVRLDAGLDLNINLI